MMGMIMLIGLVAKNAILLVDFAEHSKAKGMSTYDALLAAFHTRFRPILMTTIAMVIGMMPIAFATGVGAEMNRGLALVIIGGLLSSLFLTLVIIPVIYSIFDGIKTFIEQVGVVFIISVTAYFVLNGQMSIGMIMYHVLLFNNVSAPIRSLHRIYDEINSAMIYSESFFKILESDDQIEKSGTQKPQIHGQFELSNVDFSYPNGYQALHRINMTILPNKITALFG